MTETFLSSVRGVLDDNPIVGTTKTGRRRFWTTREEKILRENYSSLGLADCLNLLPGRSASAIYSRANQLDIRKKSARDRDFRTEKWTSTDQIDAVIRRVYQGNPTKGMVLNCARILGRPRWWVSKRAVKLGLVVPRFKEPTWSDNEIEYVAENAHKSASALRRGLKARGFARSETAILVKLKRIGIPTGRNADTDHYTANQLSLLFGVDGHAVTTWIKRGWLKATKRGTARTERQGGDENKVHRKAVRAFIIDNVALIDFRKVDKFWVVDILAEKCT